MRRFLPVFFVPFLALFRLFFVALFPLPGRFGFFAPFFLPADRGFLSLPAVLERSALAAVPSSRRKARSAVDDSCDLSPLIKTQAGGLRKGS